MRSYPNDSSQATARVLALAMVVDGHLAPSELRVLDELPLMQELDLDRTLFRQTLEDLCNDMVNTAVVHGAVELDASLLDSLLGEITAPALRRKLLSVMWKIADADGHLADAEAALLARACAVWHADARFLPQRSASQPAVVAPCHAV